jgi:hypothetical protein
LQKRRKACLSFRIILDARQHADAPHTLRLLRTRNEWPRRAAEKNNKIAPPHVPAAVCRR